MTKSSIADEVNLLMSIRPTRQELDEVIHACEFVLQGIKRGPRGYRVDPRLSPMIVRRGPASVVKEVRRGLEVAQIARRAMHAD